VCQSVLITMAQSNLSSIAQKSSRTRLAHGEGTGGSLTLQRSHLARHVLENAAIDLRDTLSTCVLADALC